jgi:hypothetical protein
VTSNFIAYIQGPTTESNAKALTIGFAAYSDATDDETTGITDIQSQHNTGTGNVYNLQGVLVRANATSLDGLPAGIYIVNGKKYSVR